MFKESEDFYIKINDGEIVTENKTGNIDFINKNTNSKQVDAVPDYTSPEYVEYISKINRDSLREINSEDINNIETVSNIRKEIKEKYPKKKIQLFIFALIIILFIAIVAVSGSMIKSVSNVNMQGVNEEFKFLTDVAIASKNDSISSYNSLKELASTKDVLSYFDYKEKVQSIKENAKRNLNDVNSLDSYIQVKNYKKIISHLEERYYNLIELCDKLLEVGNVNAVYIYNTYVPKETTISENLDTAIIEKAKEFNIDYKVEDEKIILYID